jgi:predicted NUDIX family NTP pyrophosphohydrolase
MPKRSAGLIMYRWTNGELEVFLVHPSGTFIEIWFRTPKEREGRHRMGF